MALRKEKFFAVCNASIFVDRPGRRTGPKSICYFLFPLLFGAWVSADAATDLTVLEVLGLLKSLEAFEATDCEVCSLRAIVISDHWLNTSATST